METISLIADICGILGFLVSLFVASRVMKISNKIDANIEVDKSNKQTAFGKENKQKITNK